MNAWIDIVEYRDFHDVPRIFVVDLDGTLLLFDCQFDEVADEYPNTFEVYQLHDNIALPLDWSELASKAARHKGQISVSDVVFDESRRKRVRRKELEASLSEIDE